ncbi:unnamed protein product, partial [Rotaria magnacalcarata]
TFSSIYFCRIDNFRMALNKDYEVEISDDSAVTASEEFPSFRDKPATNIKEKMLIKVKKTLCVQPKMVEAFLNI